MILKLSDLRVVAFKKFARVWKDYCGYGWSTKNFFLTA